MTTNEIAEKLVNYCRQGQWDEALAELYSDQAVSIEPSDNFGPARVEGMEAIKIKGAKFNEMVEEMYGGEVSDPIVAGNFISLKMTMDVKFHGRERVKSEEICLYEVKDGKIISEQFFY